MGKVTCDAADTDTSDDERRKTVREVKIVHREKKKRKRNLTDSHQRLFKSKQHHRSTNKSWQSNFITVLQHFADLRQKYDKESKIRGKLEVARNSKRISTRILPKPCSGIYRNGTTGKEIRRSQIQIPLNDSSIARLEGNVFKLLNGYDSKSEPVVVENNIKGVAKKSLLHSQNGNISQLIAASDVQCVSPILDNVVGTDRFLSDDDSLFNDISHKFHNQKKGIESESYFNTLWRKYKGLCKVITAKNFQGQNFPTDFMPDPLIAIKKKLRSSYAASYRDQFLCAMRKRKAILNETESPFTSVETDFSSGINCDFSGIGAFENPDSHFSSKTHTADDLEERHNPFLIPELDSNFHRVRKTDLPSSNLLFDSAILNRSNKASQNTENKGRKDNLISKGNQTSLELHKSTTTTWHTGNITYIETNTNKASEKNKSLLFGQLQDESKNNFANKKNVSKQKDQGTQLPSVSNCELKKNVGKQNLKISQQIKSKNLKHIPAILRRCSNSGVNNSSRINLFQESMHMDSQPQEIFDTASKQNILFSRESLTAELNQNARSLQTSESVNTVSDGNSNDVHTCVIASPSVQNDNMYFIKNSDLQTMEKKNHTQTLDMKDNVVKKNYPKQKTAMFTKKDSRNIGQCLLVNSLISDGAVNSSNVCIIKKSVPVEQEKAVKNTYTLHRNCCKAISFSQDAGYSDYERQEFKESAPVIQKQWVQQEPIVCKKLLTKSAHEHLKHETNQKCLNDHHLCYVAVDQCNSTSNFQECPNNTECRMKNTGILQNDNFCREDVVDVGILKGVQNLKFVPIEEQEIVKFTNKRCTNDAVVFEEQPIKYLAFESDSRAEKIPIYMQKTNHSFAANNANVANPNVSCCMVSCPQESAQKIILVPSSKQNNVVYVEQQNLPHSHASFEGCGHLSSAVLYRPQVQCIKSNSSRCDGHVPNQNVIIRNECEAVLSNIHPDNNIKILRRNEDNWEKSHYRLRHGKI